MGFCPQCGFDRPLIEDSTPAGSKQKPASAVALRAAKDNVGDRFVIGWGEIDRVLGGGLVAGSVLLVGGEPGVGKSTLLLQVAGFIAERGGSVLVASAEESAHQVAMRAHRLGIDTDSIRLVSDDDTDAVVALAEEETPDLLIIDSIQTVGVGELSGAPGGVAQVRESAARLVRLAKRAGIPVVLVGHVTKDGGLAGPKLLEHMVDVVLYLEGDPDRGFRVLRSMKNRFGPTHVSGMFDMQSEGLVEVDDPSKVFLSGWESDVAGTVVFPAVEGRRAVLVEIQALVTDSSLAQPRRSIRGLDPTRVNQVIAVLDRHARLELYRHEIYVNVVGGWTIGDPGCDLAVALAIASSRQDKPLGRLAAYGEVGLAGEVRGIPFEARRIEELDRMGITQRISPGGGEPMRLLEALETTDLMPGLGGR